MARVYSAAEGPALHSVPLTVLVLAKNEELNIGRCLASCGWAEQVIVVDSGSADQTVSIARAAGAEVVETHWRGFGPQREFAMRLPQVRHEWVYFVDADEWVSGLLAREVKTAIQGDKAAYSQLFRLVFQGRWIAHCGWYPSSRIVRLMRPDSATFDPATFSEHPTVSGELGQLANDLVDEDQKGLARWLHKHVDYAGLEASRRRTSPPRARQPHEPLLRHLVKDRLAPRLPGRPVVQFLYMYLVRGGFLDGRAGLAFCTYHAWFQRVVSDLGREAAPDPGGRAR